MSKTITVICHTYLLFKSQISVTHCVIETTGQHHSNSCFFSRLSGCFASDSCLYRPSPSNWTPPFFEVISSVSEKRNFKKLEISANNAPSVRKGNEPFPALHWRRWEKMHHRANDNSYMFSCCNSQARALPKNLLFSNASTYVVHLTEVGLSIWKCT